mgnify:CR=1 FL=1
MNRRNMLRVLSSLPVLGWVIPSQAEEIKWTPELARKHLNRLLNSASHVSRWDLAAASGETLKEKINSLFVALNCLDILCNEDNENNNCIIAGSTTGSLLAQSGGFKHSSLEPVSHSSEHLKFQKDFDLWFQGTVNNRWRLYFTQDIDQKEILVINDKDLRSGVMPNPKHYGKIEVQNFI